MIEKTAEEVFESINGFDEIGIEMLFGAEITDLRNKPFKFLRALVFVERKHAGCTHDEAHKFSMEMNVKDLQDYFEGETLEVVPDEPVSEAGKDESVPEIGHVIRLDSV